MCKILNIIVLLFLLTGTLFSQDKLSEYEQNWPQWRGPYATGIAPAGDPPIEWNENLNIKWKSEIPGVGHATPIIWKDQIILLSAVPTEKMAEQADTTEAQEGNQWMSPTKTDYIHKFVVMSVDRNNGKIVWQTIVLEALPHGSTHRFGSWASNSPVTDGENIYAYFGSRGLYCLNMEGDIQWEHDFGPMEKVMSFGEGSSPTLYKEKLIIVRDHQGQSTLHVMDKNSGDIIWEIEREEVSSWATPYIIEIEGETQVITSATNSIRSYNLENGELIWECSGLTRNVIPMPVSAKGVVYLMSGFRGSALLAVDLSKAKGDISDSEAIKWSYDKNTPYTPSPVLMNDKLYFLKVNNGYLSCLDANDGKEYYTTQKLDGIKEIFTSPVGISDRLYIAGTNGIFYVIKQGEKFEVLAQNQLDDSFLASPVIIDNSLYLRGVKHLYCISNPKSVLRIDP